LLRIEHAVVPSMEYTRIRDCLFGWVRPLGGGVDVIIFDVDFRTVVFRCAAGWAGLEVARVAMGVLM
jgi:hypothetical protein